MDADVVLTIEEMQDRDKWLQVRNTGIGGSDAAVIVGANKWKSPLTLWLEKTGQQEPEDLSDNERVYWGSKNEANIADWFMSKTGKKVIRRGLMRSKSFHWMLATVDRLVVGEDAGLEIKTAGVDQAKKWENDEVPDSYYLQCQWYMAVTGLTKWYIAVLIGGNHAIYKEIPRNEDTIMQLVEASKRFWLQVKGRIQPEVDGSASCAASLGSIYPESNGMEVALPENCSQVFAQLAEVKRMIEELDTQKTALENTIKATLGDNEAGVVNGYKATWRTQAGRTSIDSKKLKAEQPEVFAKYSKTGAPVRVLRISTTKGDN